MRLTKRLKIVKFNKKYRSVTKNVGYNSALTDNEKKV